MIRLAPNIRPKPGRLRPAFLLAAILLLTLHFALAVGSKLHESTTSDELVHLTAGVSYWKNHDYRLHPENGILPQRWAALPTWLSGARFPDLQDNEYWRFSDAWVIGHQFFYETGEDHFPHLMSGRAMIALISVATGGLIFWWSRRLFGDIGGLISLAFYSFSPEFLAHGALVTSDIIMAFFFLAAMGTWWWHLHDGRKRVWFLTVLTMALAFVAKYSAILLLPMIMLLAIVRAFAPEPLAFGRQTFSTRAGKFGAITLSGVGQALVVIGVIWTFYGFRYSAFNPLLPPANQFIHQWEAIIPHIGIAGEAINALTAFKILPEGFLYGLAYVIETTSTRAAFLNGDYSITGWPSFFPWTFVLKTTLPLLLAGILIPCLALHRCSHSKTWRRNLYRVTPLIVLFLVYWAFSLTSHLNIGHRHLLPIYLVIFIALGVLGSWVTSGSWVRLTAIAALLGWHVAESVRIAPHYLAYFNQLGGGPDHGWHHLVDSSLDWGQDLPSLKKWLDANASDTPVFLSYFGTGEPAYYGLTPHRLVFINNFKFPQFYVPLKSGIYCISATALQQVYSPARGPWTVELEKEYQQLRQFEPTLASYENDPVARAEFERLVPRSQWQRTIVRHDILRLARLCHYLRVRTPDANAGHSILIYRLTPGEVIGATAGSLGEWAALIEKAVTEKP